MVSFILPGNSATGGYEVANSLRFDDGSSDSLTRDIGSNGNKKLFTFSFWVKRSSLGAEQRIFMGDDGGNGEDFVQFKSDDKIKFASADGSQYLSDVDSTRVFRDLSSWYHVVIAYDSAQSTASNRIKFYVNGVQETVDSSPGGFPDQNTDILYWNTSGADIDIGARTKNSNLYFDGYLAEVVMIDGQALDPTSFGEFDSDSPTIWKPIDVSGLTFGTNGFYLDFENASSLGADVSGNSNNFTVNNLTSVDQSTDTCTNNFATMNPLVINTSAESSFAEGNLQVSTTNSGVFGAVSTIGVSSGKWYWEVKPTQIQNKNAIGVTAAASADAINNHRPGDGSYSAGIRSSGDAKLNGSSESGSWDSFTTSDIVGVALDLDNNKLYFSKNGTFMNSGDPTSGSTGTGAISLTDPASTTDGFYFFAFGDPGAGSGTANIAQFNFGSPPYSISSGNSDGNGYGNFEYSVPSGYYALNTKNLAEYG